MFLEEQMSGWLCLQVFEAEHACQDLLQVPVTLTTSIASSSVGP
jgi:hypothetical protein